MKKYFIFILIILPVMLFFVLFHGPTKRYLTGLFFRVNLKPVNLTLKNSYPKAKTDEKTKEIVSAANLFLNSLDGNQKNLILFPFSDNAQRSNWSNFPEGMLPRTGLKLGELSNWQRRLLDELLSTLMSEKGFLNINYQLAAEDSIPNNSFLKYGSKYFVVAFLGQPTNNYPWMFQLGGHHLAINVTIYGAEVTFSPLLTGGEPIQINYNGQDILITEEEIKAAQTFLNSLNEEQKKTGGQGKEIINLQSGPGEYATPIQPKGIKGSGLNQEQKDYLLVLIETRLGFINEDDFPKVVAVIKRELDDTYFGWWGDEDKLGSFYFRITGPSIIMEYAPQFDDETNTINHVHSIYRNPKNDYGKAWLEE